MSQPTTTKLRCFAHALSAADALTRWKIPVLLLTGVGLVSLALVRANERIDKDVVPDPQITIFDAIDD